MSHKAYDDELMFWDAQSTASGFTVAASPVYSATLDLKGADLDELNPGQIVIHWPDIAGATATLEFVVCTKATSPPTVTEEIVTTIPYPIADIIADDEIRIALPSKGMLQYVRLAVNVGTADISAGTLTAGIVPL